MEPLKLMCISNKEHVNTDIPKIEISAEVVAIDETAYNGLSFWMLAEYPGGMVDGKYHDFWYDKRLFTILPDPSEEVAIEAEQEALIYQR